MSIHALAGEPAQRELLTNIPRLVSAYYTHKPDPAIVEQQVSFGTSGHRGTSMESPLLIVSARTVNFISFYSPDCVLKHPQFKGSSVTGLTYSAPR